MSSPNPASSSLVLVDHYIHPSTTIAACDPQPIMMERLEEKPLRNGTGRRQQKKQKILHHQPTPLAPRLIAPLQARPRFARCAMSTSAAAAAAAAAAAVKDVEMMATSVTSANNNNKIMMMMPPMPTTPHELAREAMRITQEAMKKQKLQDLQLQKQQQQQQQQTSSSSSMLLQSPPLPLQQQQSEGAFPSTSVTATKTGANNINSKPSSSSSSSTLLPTTSMTTTTTTTGHVRLNKFVRRLHDMLRAEKNGGIVEWRRRGLLVLHNTHLFAKTILPKWFSTRNFKTFRRQLNYYGFVHVRSFSNTTTDQPSTTTALWVHQELAAAAAAAQHQQQPISSSSCSSSSLGSAAENNQAHHHHNAHCNNRSNDNNGDNEDDDDIAAVLQLRRVEACDTAIPKTAEGRRYRKEQAIHTVEEDLGVNAKTLQMEHIQSLLVRGAAAAAAAATTTMTACGDNVDARPMTNTSVIPQAGTTTFTNKALECIPRFNKNDATIAATATATLQRLQPRLLPLAVPLEISVPRNGGSSSAALLATWSDQEMTQGAANLLLMLSKAV